MKKIILIMAMVGLFAQGSQLKNGEVIQEDSRGLFHKVYTDGDYVYLYCIDSVVYYNRFSVPSRKGALGLSYNPETGKPFFCTVEEKNESFENFVGISYVSRRKQLSIFYDYNEIEDN